MSMDPGTIMHDLFAQMKGDHVFVMDLPHYRQIRKLFWTPCADEIDADGTDTPEEAMPHPDDRLLGYPIDVRENGGKPHIEWRVRA